MIEMDEYINYNKNGCVINCIRDYFLENKSFEESLKEIADLPLHKIWHRELALVTKKELEKASYDLEYLKKILNEYIETNSNITYESLESYIEQKFETDKTIEEIQTIIRNNLLSMENDDYKNRNEFETEI